MRNIILTIGALLAALVLSAPAPALAAAPRWDIDPPHSYVGFFIKHILAPVQGVFNTFGGAVVFDPDDAAGSSIDVSIEVASLDTRNAQRNAHLLSDDFFAAAKYPSMRFVSQRIESLGQGRYVAHGQLTIKDVTKPLDLPFSYLGRVTSPMDPRLEVAGFTARLTLDRLEYGVGDGKFFRMGAVGKDVEVIINLEVTRLK